MDLQTFINQNKDNYIDLFKQEKLVYRKYPKLNLLVVKRKYGSDFSTDKSWLNYCRGAIIGDVISIPEFTLDLLGTRFLTLESFCIFGAA